ncbi:RIP metalloprotease RseP [Porticoccus sp. GXU_MW_L64]
MDILSKAFYFLIAIAILVSFHEYGHFWVARRCGIKVLRFSIGFGKPIVTWTDKLGTEYVIAWIPLGGYVRMVDEREDDVDPDDLPYAFNRKPVWQRMAVVLAGPAANFLLAIVFYWLIALFGVAGYAPFVKEVTPGSVAERAGLSPGMEIVAVDGVPINSLQDLNKRLVLRLGDRDTVRFSVFENGVSTPIELSAELGVWEIDDKNPDLLKALGMTWGLPENKETLSEVSPVVGMVVEGSAAHKAGLQYGDQMVAVDGVATTSWNQWAEYISQRPGELIVMDVRRSGQLLSVDITPDAVEQDGATVGRVGVGHYFFRTDRYGPLDAIGYGVGETWSTIAMTLQTLGKMVTGDISFKHLSGPLGIATVASQSAQSGLISFLGLLALLSVSLGVLNLLPIPVLDGGHFMYYLVEAIKGSPVSEKVQLIGYKIGLFLVMGLMIFAIGNDIRRELPDDSAAEQNTSDQ